MIEIIIYFTIGIGFFIMAMIEERKEFKIILFINALIWFVSMFISIDTYRMQGEIELMKQINSYQKFLIK